jgi:DNA-binding transcriptional LysR family regulator
VDQLIALRHFVRVAERRSFSAAARDARTTQSTVSHAVRQLEEYLGAQLLQRTTRRVSLTDEGAAYLERARRVIADLEDADASIGRRARAVTGTLRVFAPVSIGRLYLVKRLADLVNDEPQLEVELDMIEGRFDVALRVGPLADSSARVRRLGEVERVFVAARSLVPTTPTDPAQLAALPAVIFDGPVTIDSVVLERGGQSAAIALTGRFRTNSSEAMLEALLAGAGWTVAPMWLVQDALRKRALVRLVPAWHVPSRLPLFALYPEGRAPPRRVRVFLDLLEHALIADGVVLDQ